MSNDLNGTVVGIQGTPVSSVSPNEGDALVFDGYNWVPTARGLTSQIFTENDTWTCPAGITTVIITGWGGGGGGGNGVGNNTEALGGSGGGGALKNTSIISVSPGTIYNIEIGGGGGGGAGGTTAHQGGGGGTTSFGSIFYAFGGGGGASSVNTTATFTIGGLNNVGNRNIDDTSNLLETPHFNAAGGAGSRHNDWANPGFPNDSFMGGDPGFDQSKSWGGTGGGGGAGPGGIGGTGGSPGNGTDAENGSDANDNTGAGGGGGGGTVSNHNGGNGGDGGSGTLIIAW